MTDAAAALLALCVVAQGAPTRVTLVFGGDVIPHGPVKEVAARRAAAVDGASVNHQGWLHVLGPLSSVLRAADLAVVNLETPVVQLKRPEVGDIVFHAGPELPRALRAVGVQVASFANNHALDQHPQGILSTRAFLADAGLLAVGADDSFESAWRPLVVERRGLKVGLLAVARFLNGFKNAPGTSAPHVPHVPYPRDTAPGESVDFFLEKVREAAARVDALVVSLHWGEEYQPQPLPEDRALAQALVEAGALAVVGHHPHVLQPVQWLERPGRPPAVVAYSLGNLVSNQDLHDADGPRRDGLLLGLTLERPAGGGPVRLAELTPHAVWSDNRPGRGRSVQTLVLDEELAALEAGRPGADGGPGRDRLSARRQALLARRARILAFLPVQLRPP